MKKAMISALIVAMSVLALSVFTGSATAEPERTTEPGRWQPDPGTSWQWQLSSQPGSLLDVDAYDVDGFDTSRATVDRIHANGSASICYINVGAWENWRPDRGRFPKSVIGKPYEGWAGERFLDISRIGKIAPVMEARLDMCAEKGFDAVEPDNMDTYAAKTGFRLTRADQIRYNLWLAKEAHERGLAIGLKNTPEIAASVEPHFDFAVTEDCFADGWCRKMSPFIANGKPVFAAEYTDTGARTSEFCPKAKALKFDAILKKRNLGEWRQGCPVS